MALFHVLLDGFEPIGLQTNLSCMEIINQLLEAFFSSRYNPSLLVCDFWCALWNSFITLTRKTSEFYRFTRATFNVFIIYCGWFDSWILTTYKIGIFSFNNEIEFMTNIHSTYWINFFDRLYDTCFSDLAGSEDDLEMRKEAKNQRRSEQK